MSRVRVLHVGAELSAAETPPLPALGPRDLPRLSRHDRYGSRGALDGGLPRRRFDTAAALQGQAFTVTMHYMAYAADHDFLYCDSGVIVRSAVVYDDRGAQPIDCVLYVPLEAAPAGATDALPNGAPEAPARWRAERAFHARVRVDDNPDEQAPQSGTDDDESQ